MQVNNNYQSSPNFGMALKISKGAGKALEELPMETLENLQKAGQKLKDTKFYHVFVDDAGMAKITADKDAYFGLFPRRPDGHAALDYGKRKEAGKMVEADNIIMIENHCGTIAGVGRYVPYGQSEPFFNAWGVVGPYSKVEDVPSLAKIAKILDDVAVERYKASSSGVEEKISKTVGNLLDTFGE